MRLGIDASNIRDGGGVTHLTSLLSAADPARHGISHVRVWSSSPTLDRLPGRDWIRADPVPALEASTPRRLAWQIFGLPAVASRECDLLWVLGGNAGSIKVPLVAMSQNLLPFEPEERRRYGASWMRVRLGLLARLQGRTFHRADGVLFLTRYARDTVASRVPGLPSRTAIVPHGVDDRFRKPPKHQRSIETYGATRPFRLLSVSIIDVYKHPWVVAEEVAALRARGYPLTLDFVGPAYGPALARLRRVLSRVDPEGRTIRYVGSVPFGRLHEIYHDADAFVFGSTCENMPNILLEAMAAGLPIASSDRGPMPEVLGDGAVYFDPESPGSLARALERLLDDVAFRERCAGEAYRRAATFTWSTCAARSFEFLCEVGRTERAGEPGAAAR
jgi:glycosyltransferase involved in cell wall biosynthesis